ncbi:hypothetical protein PS914_05929 [Pseudomonas fluorescens]|uniref:DUF6602 domain-containing protein n=1 Tax=Pseudomonas fluorescens TaxID=294 RepID=UPI00124034A2|nr:DUF6602 domain-containing protein [Pseudomonas fluorescens]VVQ16913.1 hypothetical protein PS914_05929 [Pseudomonas fluorescens]
MSDLLKLIQIEADEVNLKFAKASLEGRGTPQEVADRRESVIQLLIAKYFPFPFRIAKGNIVDSFGNRSASIDCIVLNPEHPHTVSESKLYSVILADGTDFAIEVKPDLTSQTEIERALKQIQSVKNLTRSRNRLPITGNPGKIHGIIFSNTTYTDIDLLLSYILEFYKIGNVKRAQQFDMLIVNNRLLLLNCRHGHSFWPQQGAPEGILILHAGKNTLAAAIMFMNGLPLSRMRMDESVLTNYIAKSELGPAAWNDAINEGLDKIESSE